MVQTGQEGAHDRRMGMGRIQFDSIAPLVHPCDRLRRLCSELLLNGGESIDGEDDTQSNNRRVGGRFGSVRTEDSGGASKEE